MEHCETINGKRIPKSPERNLSQCHFLQLKSCMTISGVNPDLHGEKLAVIA
jgi:hypothetical protein